VAFDVVPPLQYVGFETYKKDYQEFLDQCQGTIDVEYRDLNIVAGNTVAFGRGLERMIGTLRTDRNSTRGCASPSATVKPMATG